MLAIWPMPTLTQLEYIVAVDKTRHFGQAAKLCNVSQPTLSMQIQKAEEEFHTAIFDRQKKPVIPTPRGVQFIEQARAVLREHDKLREMSRDRDQGLSGEFRLGVIPTLAPYILPRFLASFARMYPKVRLSVDELKTETICDMLQADQLDAGLMATPLKQTGFTEEVLFYEPLFLYLSSGHPLLQQDQIRAENLDGRELWLLHNGHCFRNQVVQFCSLRGDEGLLKNVKFEAGSLETLKAIVKRSYGYTFVPQLLVEGLSAQETRDHVREFKAPVPTREISLVYRRQHYKTEVQQALAQTIIKTTSLDLREVNRKKHVILEFC